MAKKKNEDDSKVFIGRKKSINYVMAAMVILNENRPVKLLARGRSISRAVDVGEILKNNFIKGSEYGEVLIQTEEITNKDGTKSNVSSIEIELLPPKA
ncbi:MAG: DNA/RNA-binding protein AlbA [Promethearchaeota archaeon]|nr:MAG: DNA/RNA-binding protein AlbA [Candidatus Lokiarchaeota archaeon]